MPTSAAGSRGAARRARGAGFTLIELLVTLLVMALLTGLAALALPHGRDESVQREAQRLAALFDAARSEAADGSMPLVWAPGASGYAFLRPTPLGWRPLQHAPLAPRAWAWSGAEVQAHYLPPPPRGTSVEADGVQVRVDGGSSTSGAPPGWLVFGTEPVSPPIRVVLIEAGRQWIVSSDGISPFATSSQR